MTSQKIRFLAPTPSVHMRPHEPETTPPYTFLFLNGWYNNLLDLNLKFDYTM